MDNRGYNYNRGYYYNRDHNYKHAVIFCHIQSYRQVCLQSCNVCNTVYYNYKHAVICCHIQGYRQVCLQSCNVCTTQYTILINMLSYVVIYKAIDKSVYNHVTCVQHSIL